MANKYSDEERTVALKLADEIGQRHSAKIREQGGHHLWLAESSEWTKILY